MLLLLDEKKKRRKSNLRGKELGAFQAGVKVRAIYSDEENEPAWYEAVIDSVSEDVENKYWVTFPEYGNTECVDLGDMELLDKSVLGDQDSKDDHHRGGRGLGDDGGGGYSRDSRDRLDSRGIDNRRGGTSRGSRSRSRDRREGDGGRLGGGSSSSSTSNLLEKVMQSQRDQSSTGGKP